MFLIQCSLKTIISTRLQIKYIRITVSLSRLIKRSRFIREFSSRIIIRVNKTFLVSFNNKIRIRIRILSFYSSSSKMNKRSIRSNFY